MIIIRVMGGLGNQMFQYALYRKLKWLGKNVKIDTSIYDKKIKLDVVRPFELNVFENLQFDIASNLEIRKTCRKCNNVFIEELLRNLFGNRDNMYYEKENGYVDEKIYQFEDIYLSGYWQNISYFEDISELLKNEFVFKKSKKEENEKLKEQILDSQSISVHIRRGDYLKNEQIYGGICTEQYYKNAFGIMSQKYTNIKYFFFTDDIEYVKQKYHFDNMVIVDANQKTETYYDMYLMSLCKGNIIANSSFSWWAAFLNSNADKTVISPNRLVSNSVVTEQQKVKGWIYLN